MKITPLTPACLPPGARLWLRPAAGSEPGAVGQAVGHVVGQVGGQAGEQVLSPQEIAWGEALAPAGRKRYWQSRAVMRQVLAAALDCSPQVVPLRSPPGQPPELEGGWVSLSHSGEGLLVGYAPRPIGVDLEWRHRRLDGAALMQRFFPAQEVAHLQGLAGDALRQAVLTSWVAKEAVIKWRRRSLAEELGAWCFDHGSARLRHLIEGLEVTPAMGCSGGWLWASVVG